MDSFIIILYFSMAVNVEIQSFIQLNNATSTIQIFFFS